MKIRTYTLLILLFSTVAANSLTDNSQTSPSNLVTDSHKAVVVAQNNPTFTINLRSNPTTGYSWVLQSNYNDHFIKPVSHTYHAPDSKIVGAPGYESFVFEISKKSFVVPHMMHLTFSYVRPWEGASKLQNMTFTIVAR